MKLNFPPVDARFTRMSRGDAHLWQVLDRKLEMLRTANHDLSETIRLAENAVGVARKAFGDLHPNTAASLEKLGDLLMAHGERHGAGTCYEEALGIYERMENVTDTARAAGNLAWVFALLERHEQSRHFYQQAIAATESFLPETHQIARLLNNLAGVCEALSRHDEAEAHYLRALAISEAALDRYHPDIASLSANLGTLYFRRGDLEKAIAMLLRALIVCEQACEANDPALGQTLGKLAAAYHASKDLKKAEVLYEKSISVFQESEEDVPADYLTIAMNYATLLREVGKTRKAMAIESQL